MQFACAELVLVHGREVGSFDWQSTAAAASDGGGQPTPNTTMPTDAIQNLIADCHKTAIPTPDMGDETKRTLDVLTSRLNAIIQETEAAGTNATEAQNAQWDAQLKELKTLLSAIQQIGDDGPADPSHEMYKEFASNARIYTIGIWAIVFTTLMICLIVHHANKGGANGAEATGGLPPEVAHALPLVAVAGALGGFLTCIQSFGRYVGNRQFLRSWTLYYFLFPLKGAGLAIIVFFLIHTDLGRQLGVTGETEIIASRTNQLVLPASLVTNITTSASGQSLTNISTNLPASRIELVTKPTPPKPEKPNLVMACLIAALTGMFANQAIEMLAGVFTILFKKVDGKDGYRDTQNNATATAKPAGK